MSPADLGAVFAPHLGLDASALTFLRQSQNVVFGYRDGAVERIFRVTLEEHRSRDEIAAELAWIDHLRKSGAAVCAPVRGSSGIITASCGGTTCHGVAFEKAPGRPVERGDLSPALYRAHGRTLGTFHRAAAGFPTAWAASRRSWDEERYFGRDLFTYLPAEQREALGGVFARLRDRVNSAERSKQTFGPVHFDLGYSNFFVAGNQLAVFDFDNCTAGPFLGDIAAALYGIVRCEFRGDRSAFEPPKSSAILREVLAPFREGYQSAFDWPPDEHLQSWLDLRYFRSVVHALRVQSPVTNPNVRKALAADVDNLLTGRTPVRV